MADYKFDTLLCLPTQQKGSALADTLDAQSLDGLLPMLRRNTVNGTLLHKMVSTRDLESISVVLQKVPEKSSLYEVLRIVTSGGRSAIHEAAALNQFIAIRCLLDGLTNEHTLEILLLQDAGGATALHVAVSKSNMESISCILELLSQEQKLILMDTQNCQRESVMDGFFQCSPQTRELLKSYANSASTFKVNRTMNSFKRFPSRQMKPEFLDNLLISFQQKDAKQALDFILNKLRHTSDVDEAVLSAVLMAVPESDRVVLLKSHNILGTALHCAASRHQNNIVLCILSSLSKENAFQILKIDKDDGSTIMHTCFHDNNTEILKEVFQRVNESEAIKLLAMKDTAKLTCIDYAVRKKHTAVIQLLLDEIDVTALLHKGLLRTAELTPLSTTRNEKANILEDLMGNGESAQLEAVKKSYSNWRRSEPIRCGVTKLSKLGLKYIGMDDLVNCTHCQETFHLLSKADDKLDKHLNSDPGKCKEEENGVSTKAGHFRRFDEKLVHYDERKESDLDQMNHQKEGQECTAATIGPQSEEAEHHYSKLVNRLASMKNLKPRDATSINLIALAQKGCYYTGITDLIQCVTCQGRFKLSSDRDHDVRLVLIHTSYKSCLVDKPTDITSEPEKDIREESLKVFMNCLQLEKMLTNLRVPNQTSDALLHQLDGLRLCLIAIPPGKRLALLMTSNDLGSIMHKLAAIQGSLEMIECITNFIRRENYYHFMKIQDECGQTAMHVAARNGHLVAVACMLEHLLPTDRVRILEMRDTGHLTPFHHVVKRDLQCKWIFQNLLPKIEPDHLISFLELQLNLEQGITSETLETLREYKQRIIPTPSADTEKLRRLIRNQDTEGLKNHLKSSTDKQSVIREALELSLTSEQIEVLSNISEQYVIPRDQTVCAPRGLVFYCAKDRVGAEEEAEKMRDALTCAGFSTHVEEWSNFYTLRLKLREMIEEVSKKTSVLVVCIMSHGIRGHVHGNGGNYGSINTVMYDMRCELPDYIPMILMVQACQTTQSESDNSSITDSRQAGFHHSYRANTGETEHIILRRPHTALLLSTIPGGRSIRGLYTSALAQVLSESKEKQELRGLHSAAVRKIKKHIDYSAYEQIPEYRDTFDKTLYIGGNKSNPK